MLLVLAAVSVTACQEEDTALVRVVDSPMIDSLLAAAPQTVIDMDALEEEVWLADLTVGVSQDTLILGSAEAIASVGDSLYIADEQANAIWAVSLDGKLRRRIGGKGKGPVEFSGLQDIDYNGRYVFVHEGGSQRVQALTDKFEYAGSFQIPAGLPEIAVTSKDLFVPCRKGMEWLICIRDASLPFEFRQNGLLRSLNLSPVSYDFYRITAVPSGELTFIGYRGLPYLFVYDTSREHVQTIRFHGSFVRELADNPTIEMPGVPFPGMRNFIRAVFFLGDNYLAFVHRFRTYVIDIGDGSNYRHVKTIKFKRTDGSANSTDKSILVDHLLLKDGYLYVVSTFEEYAHRYPFEL